MHPSEKELAAFARGGTAVAADLAEHLAECTVCGVQIAAMRRTEPSAHGPTFAPGTMIGRYRIDACLGAGGMGVVYRAHDTELDRAVALKLVRPLGNVEALTARLRRESRLQARATHRAVITIYDVGRADDQLFVAMELLQGSTLSDWLRERRPWRATLDVFREAAAGLAAAHAAGLVHRDFKPDNVLVELRDGEVARVAVTDFGIARALEAAHEEPSATQEITDVQMTAPGQLVGTPAYMSPEQLDGSDVDERSDVFSFSVALWEALYGARPFGGTHVAMIAAAMAAGPPRVPSPRTSRVPTWVGEAVLRGLAISRDARPPTIAALVAPLDWRRRARRRAALVAGAGVLAVIGAAAGGYMLARAGDVSPCDGESPAAGELEEARDAIARASWFTRPQLGAYWRNTTRDYVERWQHLRAAACTAPRPADADDRASCLDRVGSDAAALLGGALALGEARRDDALRGLVMVAPQECATASAPSITALHPDNADVRAARLAIAEARGQLMAGRDAGLARARAHVRVAAAVFAPLAHELALIEALQITDPRRFDDAVRRIALDAQRAGHWSIAAYALLSAARGRDSDRDVHAAADIALLRAGDPPYGRAYWHLGAAWLAIQRSDRPAALAAIARARALAASAGVPYDTWFQFSLGTLYLACGDRARAEQAMDALIAFANVTGVSSATMAYLHTFHAEVLIASGRPAAARAELEPLLVGTDPRQRLPDDILVDVVQMLARAELEGGSADAALATLDRLQTALGTPIAVDDIQNAGVLGMRAVTLLALDRAREAEPLVRRSLELYSRAFGDRAPHTISAHLLLGDVLAKIGDDDRAIAELERALGEGVPGAYDPIEIPHARCTLGDVLLRAGRPRDARALAEQALAEIDPSPATAIPERGEARWLLARTLIDSEPERARALIDGALADWANAPNDYASEIAAATRMRAR